MICLDDQAKKKSVYNWGGSLLHRISMHKSINNNS